MDTKPEEFRFDYKKYESKQLTVEKLDEMFASFASPGINPISQIIFAIRLGAFAVYLWTRLKLINGQEQIEKQEYERKRATSQRGDLEKDDLD